MSPSCRVRSGFVVFPGKWNETSGNRGHECNDDISFAGKGATFRAKFSRGTFGSGRDV